MQILYLLFQFGNLRNLHDFGDDVTQSVTIDRYQYFLQNPCRGHLSYSNYFSNSFIVKLDIILF